MSQKDNCLKCKKKYTLKTLNKYNGICGKCAQSKNILSDGKKLNIPKKIKERCWRLYVGNTLDGKCYSCTDVIKFNYFHVGHILSEYDGGCINICNLRPICAPCNLSSGVMNLNVFKQMLKPKNKKMNQKNKKTNQKNKKMCHICTRIDNLYLYKCCKIYECQNCQTKRMTNPLAYEFSCVKCNRTFMLCELIIL